MYYIARTSYTFLPCFITFCSAIPTPFFFHFQCFFYLFVPFFSLATYCTSLSIIDIICLNVQSKILNMYYIARTSYTLLPCFITKVPFFHFQCTFLLGIKE